MHEFKIDPFDFPERPDAEDATEEGGLADEIAEAVAALVEISKSSVRLEKLHEIERMMVQDVVNDSRHLKCSGCLRWMRQLIAKASPK